MKACIEDARGYLAVPDTVDEFRWLTHMLFPESGALVRPAAPPTTPSPQTFSWVGLHDRSDEGFMIANYGSAPQAGDWNERDALRAAGGHSSTWGPSDDRCLGIAIVSPPPVVPTAWTASW